MYKVVRTLDLLSQTLFDSKSYVITLFLFLNTSLFSQNNENQWIISAGYSAVDLYPSGAELGRPYYPQGKIFEDFFNVSDHWNFGGPTISVSKLISKSFYLGIEMSINDIKKIEGQQNIDFPYYSGEVFLRKTFNNRKKLRPFVESGFGISGIDRGLFGDSIPFSQYFSKILSPSFGLQYRLTNHIGLEISSSFNKALDKKGISHLRHNFSVYIGLGDTDKDGDGIINRKDKCPKIPGNPEFNGCPDTDGDSIPDPEDKCPEVFGEQVNNGCPNTDNLSKENKMSFDDNLESQIGTESSTFSDNISNMSNQSSDEKADITQEENTSEIKIPDDQMLIYFPANSSRVLGKKTIKKLKNVVGILLSEMDLKVLLEGHSSNDGDFSINLNLSRQRANIVRDFLIEEGIESNRISVKALGEDEPIFDNNTTQGRVLNRCVLIIIKR
jgi:outer membrane protein OmpA-like peptidoglycan-associated protein